ncbi:MAG TPA: hypothetical protein VFJ21_09490 [Mycobacteriales bacterium]|nr:hypothetical protein [Mycobacteriales bacterium]
MVQVGFTERDRGKDERHGTPYGASRHSKRGEPPCDACRAAKAEYDRRNRAIPERTARNRLRAKAQQRALAELKKAHESEYRRLYVAHKAALEAEQIRARGGA